MPLYRRLLPGLVLLLLAAHAPADEERGAATQRIATEAGDFSLAFPTGWTVATKKDRPAGAKLLSVLFAIPEHKEKLLVSLFLINGAYGPLQQAFTERRVLFRRHNALRAVVGREPHPHLEIDFEENDQDLRLVHSYAMIKGNSFSIAAEGPRTLWPTVRAAVLDLIGSLKAKVKPYPSTPAGYTVKVRDGFTYYIHDDAQAKDVDAYHKVLRKRQRAFEKRHGKINFNEQGPVSIVFHARRRDATRLSQTAADDDTGQSFDMYGRRLFATPVRKGSGPKRASLYHRICGFLFRVRYRSAEPVWLYQGEVLLAHSEGEMGKPLPHAAAWLKEQSSVPQAFEDLLAYEGREQDDEAKHAEYREACALYVAVFRHGPRKCRNGFRKFLTALDKDGDGEAAAKAHLLSLDRKILRDAAVSYLEKISSKGR